MKIFLAKVREFIKDSLEKFSLIKNKELDIAEKEEHVWFMPKTVILDELLVRRYVLFTCAIICVILTILFLWSALATVDEVAVTYGEVITETKVSQIQHLEGGIVKNVYVKEGQEVVKNQLLISMDETAFKAELQELQAKEASLTADIDRLRAFIEHKNFVQSNRQTNNLESNATNTASIGKVIQGDKSQLFLESASQRNQQEILEAQIDQKQNEIDKLKSQLVLLEQNKVLLLKEFAIYQKLLKKEYVSRMEYLIKEREVNQLESDRTNLIYELNKARFALDEYNFKLKELNTSLDKDAVNNLNKSMDDLLQVQYALNKLQDRVKRSQIYSPINGIVKGIEIVPGAIVAPNGIMMTVVPSRQVLQVETKITTLDIGHVRIGDPVRVKVLTYDYARYGNIEGSLIEISPTTFIDEVNKAPYYKGIVKLKDQYVRSKSNRLMAGMTVQADIVTGNKTVLQYLMKPIYTNISGAFHER